MELSEDIIAKAGKLKTPFLLMDTSIIRENYHTILNAIDRSRVYYAVKANPNPKILKALNEEGSSFDIASIGELKALLEIDVDPEKISYGNTIKKKEDIAFAYGKGVRLFVADEYSEVNKVADFAPGSKLFIRLQMSDSDSDWPLTKKFGTNMEKAKELLIHAKERGLEPYGISFHVGSQCYDVYAWKTALLKVCDIFDHLRTENGIICKFINTGGGMPVQNIREIPSIEEIANVINSAIEEYFPEYEELVVAAEPGRSMVGDAGIMVTEVVLRAERERADWIYLDAGVFHGLMETSQDYMYRIEIPGRVGEEDLFTLSGPTCDSVDTMYDDVYLPEDVNEGDHVYFINAGAYTAGYASHFNGIEPPKTYFLEDL